MMNVNIVVVLLLAQSLQVLGLRCYKCNQTEIFTRKCVLDSSDEVKCLDGEVCTYGRVLFSTERPDLVGCERKENCDEDRANGISCESCGTDLCNLYGRKVVSFENRVQIINLPSGTTIIKEEVHKPSVTNNNPIPFPGLNIPFFNMNMPGFGNFGFNNYGFPGGLNQPQQGGFSDNYFKPPFFISSNSDLPAHQHQQSPGFVPPYAPFIGFGGPLGIPTQRPPYITEPEAQIPIYAPGQESVELNPPSPDTEVTLQETVLQFADNNKPGSNTEGNVSELETTDKPGQNSESVEQAATSIHDSDISTSKPPSLASSILQQFPSSPSVEPNRTPSISDLVLNLGSNTNKPTKKPLVQLPLEVMEPTTTDKNEPIDFPVTVPEIIEERNTETPTNELPTNKDFGAVLNVTSTTVAPSSKETSTPSIKVNTEESDFISPTTKETPLMSRTNEDEQNEEDDDDENSVEPSLSEPENLRFNIRLNLPDNEVNKVEEIKFPNADVDSYYFEQRTHLPPTDLLTFEELNQENPETPIFSQLK